MDILNIMDNLGWSEEEARVTLQQLIEKGLVQVDNSSSEPSYILTERGKIVLDYELYNVNPN